MFWYLFLEISIIYECVSVVCSPHFYFLSGHFCLSPCSVCSEKPSHYCIPQHRLVSYSSILFSTASKASQNSHKVISFLSLSSSLDQLSFAFGLSYCMCYFLHLRGQVFFTFLGEHNRLYNLLLVPVVNPFRGDVPPPCAFLACLLYVPEDFHRFHVHFRSALTWHLSTSPGTPSLLSLDALPQTLIWKTRWWKFTLPTRDTQPEGLRVILCCAHFFSTLLAELFPICPILSLLVSSLFFHSLCPFFVCPRSNGPATPKDCWLWEVGSLCGLCTPPGAHPLL